MADEQPMGEALLIKVMEEGKLTYKLPTLEQIRLEAQENLAKLPEQYKALTNAPVYRVDLSQKLSRLIDTTKLHLIQEEMKV